MMDVEAVYGCLENAANLLGCVVGMAKGPVDPRSSITPGAIVQAVCERWRTLGPAVDPFLHRPAVHAAWVRLDSLIGLWRFVGLDASKDYADAEHAAAWPELSRVVSRWQYAGSDWQGIREALDLEWRQRTTAKGWTQTAFDGIQRNDDDRTLRGATSTQRFSPVQWKVVVMLLEANGERLSMEAIRLANFKCNEKTARALASRVRTKLENLGLFLESGTAKTPGYRLISTQV